MLLQEEKNLKKIQELEAAKDKLSDLINKLKENPTMSDEELEEISGGSNTLSVNCGTCKSSDAEN